MPNVRLLQNGKVVANNELGAALGGMFSNLDDYTKYYQSHGFQVEADPVSDTFQSGVQQLQNYGAGQGQAPTGLQSGYAASPTQTLGSAITQSNSSNPAQRFTATLGPDGGITPVTGSAAGQNNNPNVQIVNPATGITQTVPYQSIEPLLNQGWRPVDSTGQPYEMQQFNGGWVMASNQGWVPFNVYNNQGWQPGQQEAIAAGMQSGQLPSFNTGSNTTGNGAGGPSTGNGPGAPTPTTNIGQTPGFGSFAQPFSEQFNPANSTFNTTPFTEEFNFDYDTALQSPAFRRRLQEGAKLIEGAAANRGGLYSGRTGKELMRFGQEMTSDELQNEYGRAWNQFQDKKGTFLTNEAGREGDYNKALNEYRQRHDIFKGNQTDIFNRYATLSGLGQTSGSQLGSTGAQFGNTLANSIIAGGVARGNGVTNAANARIGGVSNATGNVQDLLLARQYGLL